MRHTDRDYEAELQKLRDTLIYMGGKVEEMISTSMQALVGRREDLARGVVELDHQVNRLELEADDLCMRILARRQPVASDLRFITGALKLVVDLERIGDLAVNICERVLELQGEPPLKPYIDLPRMSDATCGMVRDALDAFVQNDAERARGVVERDNVVDAYYAQIFRELLTYMMEDPRNIFRATRLQSVAKYLERIADHATNLAEMVVFMVEREDLRHRGKLGEPSAPRPPRGVLFLCVQNSARSQMAEGWARKLFPETIRVFSAGSSPAARVHPMAVEVMREVGVDLETQSPKGLDAVPLADVELVVTLCAEEVCPVFPGSVRKERWGLRDPAAAGGPDQALREAFRATRDELRQKLEQLVQPWR
jgi:phosphate transport system protein